jgi:hypothetical protein
MAAGAQRVGAIGGVRGMFGDFAEVVDGEAQRVVTFASTASCLEWECYGNVELGHAIAPCPDVDRAGEKIRGKERRGPNPGLFPLVRSLHDLVIDVSLVLGVDLRHP